MNELPKDKRPTDEMIFEEPPEELDRFLDRVISGKEQNEFLIDLKPEDIE